MTVDPRLWGADGRLAKEEGVSTQTVTLASSFAYCLYHSDAIICDNETCKGCEHAPKQQEAKRGMKLLNDERVLIEVSDAGGVTIDGKPIAAVFLEKTGYGRGTRIKGDFTMEWEPRPAVREETSPV